MRRLVPVALLATACALDPEADLEAADLRVRVEAIDDRADLVIAELSGVEGAASRAASPQGSGLTLYFLDLAGTPETLRVEARASGAMLQCALVPLAADAREAVVALGAAGAGCTGALDAGPSGDSGPTDAGGGDGKDKGPRVHPRCSDASRGRSPQDDCDPSRDP